MIRRCVRFGNRAVFSAGRVPIGSCPQVARGLGAWRFGACRDYTFRFRNRSKKTFLSTPAFPLRLWCNRNRNTPKAHCHFHAGNCGESVHPSHLPARSTFPSMAAPRPAAGHKSNIPPKSRCRFGPTAPAACRAGTHRRRSILSRAFSDQSRVTKRCHARA